VIADATEALKLKPDVAIYNLRGSAYYDKGEYEIAIADFNDALRTGSPGSHIVYHNRGNAYRGKGDYARAIADYDASIKFDPKAVFSFQNRGASKRARRYRRRAFRHQRGHPARSNAGRVRAEVVAATRSKQVPWSNSSLLGEVYLAEK
jgi:tetratricopeptide (TPR) repeat protein